MKLYSIWSEWDIGLGEHDYFKTEEAAYRFLLDNAELLNLGDEDPEEDLDQLMDDGLVHILEASINIME